MSFLSDHRRWRRIHDDLWTYHVDLKLLGLVPLGRRTVAVRRGGSRWALFSPVPLGHEAAAALTGSGQVDAIVAPTAFHNTWLPESCIAFPDATVYLTAGIKRARLPADRCRELPADLGDEVESILLGGMPKVNEIVFYHPASRSLVVSDLVFYIDERYPSITRGFTRWTGAYPGVRTSRLFRAMIRDREEFVRTLDRVLAWDFDRIVMSHGEVVESGGRGALEELRGQISV